jgi:hypothetical protein
MLQDLELDFNRWRKREILSSELIDRIHEFHQGASRDLWSLYRGIREPEIVARGLALGFLPESSVSTELLAKLEPLRAAFSTDVGE